MAREADRVDASCAGGEHSRETGIVKRGGAICAAASELFAGLAAKHRQESSRSAAPKWAIRAVSGDSQLPSAGRLTVRLR